MTQSKKRLGLSIPLTLHKRLLDLAEYRGKTINSLCLDIFWEYFEPNGGNRSVPSSFASQDERSI